MAGAKMSRDATSYLLHHIFLPPQLPHEDDFHLQHERALLDAVLQSSGKFRRHVPERQRGFADMANATLRKLY